MSVFVALKDLDGSGNNDEILNKVIENLHIPDDVADIPHGGKANQSELAYQIAWARTYLSKYGAIQNSARSVWSINADYFSVESIDESEVVKYVARNNAKNRSKKIEISNKPDDPSNDYAEFPDESKPWKERLSDMLQSMNPYGFERLAQRVLRECGFSNVEVTRKSGDGGIDGFGKLLHMTVEN